MSLRFIHTADIHPGKTCRTSPGTDERCEDFFFDDGLSCPRGMGAV